MEWSEDRTSREAQRFWFAVMDVDGDGRLSRHDMKLLYEAVDKSLVGGVVLHFNDLMNQVKTKTRAGEGREGGGRASRGM